MQLQYAMLYYSSRFNHGDWNKFQTTHAYSTQYPSPCRPPTTSQPHAISISGFNAGEDADDDECEDHHAACDGEEGVESEAEEFDPVIEVKPKAPKDQ